MHAFSSIILLALPFFVAGTPLVSRTGDPTCNTGNLQCCNATTTDSSKLGGLNVIGSLKGLIGSECTPLAVLALSGNSCNQQTLCCTGNTNEGNLIATGCTPVNVNL